MSTPRTTAIVSLGGPHRIGLVSGDHVAWVASFPCSLGDAHEVVTVSEHRVFPDIKTFERVPVNLAGEDKVAEGRAKLAAAIAAVPNLGHVVVLVSTITADVWARAFGDKFVITNIDAIRAFLGIPAGVELDVLGPYLGRSEPDCVVYNNNAPFGTLALQRITVSVGASAGPVFLIDSTGRVSSSVIDLATLEPLPVEDIPSTAVNGARKPYKAGA